MKRSICLSFVFVATPLLALGCDTASSGDVKHVQDQVDTGGPIQSDLGAISADLADVHAQTADGGQILSEVGAASTTASGNSGKLDAMQTSVTAIEVATGVAGPIQGDLGSISTTVGNTDTTVTSMSGTLATVSGNVTTMVGYTDHRWFQTAFTLDDISVANGGLTNLFNVYPRSDWEFGVEYLVGQPMAIRFNSWNLGMRAMTLNPFPQGDNGQTLAMGYAVFTNNTSEIGNNSDWIHYWYQQDANGRYVMLSSNGVSNTVAIWARHR